MLWNLLASPGKLNQREMENTLTIFPWLVQFFRVLSHKLFSFWHNTRMFLYFLEICRICILIIIYFCVFLIWWRFCFEVFFFLSRHDAFLSAYKIFAFLLFGFHHSCSKDHAAIIWFPFILILWVLMKYLRYFGLYFCLIVVMY